MPRRTDLIESFDSPINDEERSALVQRVVNSRSFAHSAILRSFLLYITENTIAGKLEAIKEQQIGSNVLGRRPDYDPAEDNIVRVRARQLRQKLEEYFADEGHHEAVVISIPKGHYVPVFQVRNAERLVEHGRPESIDSVEQTGRTETPEPSRRPLRSYFLTFVPWSIAALAVIGLVSPYWVRSASPGPAPAQPVPGIARSIWGPIFAANYHEVTVVAADSGFALWQDMTHRNISLGDYLSREYLDRDPRNPELKELAVRRFTSSADLSVSLRVSDLARLLGGRVRSEFARNINIQDLRNGNVVLIGSRRSNPWVELLEPKMNFVLENAADSPGPRFRNKSPKPGEPSSVSIPSPLESHGAEAKSMDSYAVAALLPSPSGQGKIVVVEGLSMEGTEAAGEFITNTDRFASLWQQMGIQNKAAVKPFEALLRLTAVPGGYASIDLVAYRYPL